MLDYSAKIERRRESERREVRLSKVVRAGVFELLVSEKYIFRIPLLFGIRCGKYITSESRVDNQIESAGYMELISETCKALQDAGFIDDCLK